MELGMLIGKKCNFMILDLYICEQNKDWYRNTVLTDKKGVRE